MANDGVPSLLKWLVGIYLVLPIFMLSVVAAWLGMFRTVAQYSSILYFVSGALWNVFLVSYLRSKKVQDLVDAFLSWFARRPVTIPLGSTVIAKVAVDLAIIAKIMK
jgi:hypothetical protein